MKKKLFTCIFLAVIAAISLFGLAACDNGSGYDDSALVDRIESLEEQIKNQAAAITALQTAKTNLEEQIASLEDDNTANKEEITTLKTKVEALEAANANFQQQLAALDTSSDTFADDLAKLTSNYNSLTTSVQNATHIERTVVTKEEVDAGHSIIGSWSPTVTATSGNSGYAVVGCSVRYLEYAPIFQLATCKVQITESQQTSIAEVTMTRADLDTSSKLIRGSLVTNITITDINAVSKDWTEIVFYVFH